MGRYVLRRILQMIPVVLGTTFIIYAAVFYLPGDPVQALAGQRPIPPSVDLALHQKYGLDDPLIVQYVHYLQRLLHGDLGQSFEGESVMSLLSARWPVTLKLGLTAWVLEAVFGIGLGLIAGLRRGGFLDHGVLLVTTLVISLPALALGFLAQYLFGVKLGWFPVAGISDGWPRSYLLPAIILAALDLGFVARLMRSNVIQNRRTEYVRTAVAKGLGPWRVVGKHMLRNSLIPVVTYLALSLGYLMGGAVLIEGIFNLPGVGQLVVTSIQAQEGTVVVGVCTLLVLVFVLINLVTDVLYAVLDPRIRYD
jgi:peptide/nickel transport system permease protein/oligopeptide transport system permease protein